MKPYQSAWQCACWQKRYKYKRPIKIDAVTEYFKAGLERELAKIDNSSVEMYKILEDAKEWFHELDLWIHCWYYWI